MELKRIKSQNNGRGQAAAPTTISTLDGETQHQNNRRGDPLWSPVELKTKPKYFCKCGFVCLGGMPALPLGLKPLKLIAATQAEARLERRTK